MCVCVCIICLLGAKAANAQAGGHPAATMQKNDESGPADSATPPAPEAPRLI